MFKVEYQMPFSEIKVCRSESSSFEPGPRSAVFGLGNYRPRTSARLRCPTPHTLDEQLWGDQRTCGSLITTPPRINRSNRPYDAIYTKLVEGPWDCDNEQGTAIESENMAEWRNWQLSNKLTIYTRILHHISDWA